MSNIVTFKDVCAYRNECDCLNTYCVFKQWTDSKISKIELGEKVKNGELK